MSEGVRVAVRTAAIALATAACGSTAPTTPSPPAQTYSVSSVTDGDTIQFSPPILGSTALRYLNLDAPEIGGSTQEPWASASRAQLRQLLPPSTPLTIETDQQQTDSFNRVLGHAIRGDGVNTNREQLRQGHAVLYVIWPNMAHFTEYRAAQIEAQTSSRGIWNPGAPLAELPFEYRLRIDNNVPFRPVGDYFTHWYVDPADYRRVHVNNRVFFNSRTDAGAAGYQACPRDVSGSYQSSCFASGQSTRFEFLTAWPRESTSRNR